MGAGLVRRQSTGGRGASILTGFKAARQAGFTHALVFDAGGRHDPAAVGSFLELSRKHSNDLVCGYARTSSAYPARARLARRMADAGACLAALSLAPKDVMCRLRVSPLAAVSQLSACIGLGRRAEFEFESLVRLMWMGLRLRELPVDPRPPADGVSHYQPVRDTLRIAGMSAKLFIIMLTRLPAVLISRSTGWSPAPGRRRIGGKRLSLRDVQHSRSQRVYGLSRHPCQVGLLALRLAQAPDLPAPTLLAYFKYASSGLSLGISGTWTTLADLRSLNLGREMEEITDPSKLTYDARGLIPCVVQQHDTGEVLMVAWMNEESVGLTLKTGTTWFWSRSRQELWNKGATSGNMQEVKELWADCDSDTLLVKVDSPGPACHTGNRTCFFKRVEGGVR